MDGGLEALVKSRQPATLRRIEFIGQRLYQFSFEIKGGTELLRLEPSQSRWVQFGDAFFGPHSEVSCSIPLECPGVIVGMGLGSFLDFEFDYSKNWQYRDLFLCFDVLET